MRCSHCRSLFTLWLDVIQEIIKQEAELIWLIQLNPVTGPGHDFMGKTLTQPMEAEGSIIVGGNHRQLGASIAIEGRVGIEPQYLPEYRHYRFPRGGPEISE